MQKEEVFEDAMNTRNVTKSIFFFFFHSPTYRYRNYTHNHKNAIETFDAWHALVGIRAILPLMACADLH